MPFDIELDDAVKEKLEMRYKDLIENGKNEGINFALNSNITPIWFDKKKLDEAQSLAKKSFACLFMAHFAGLLLLFQMPFLLGAALATGKHNTLSSLFVRYFSTFVQIRRWYESNPFEKNSRAQIAIKRTLVIHKTVSRNLNNHSIDNKVKFTQYELVCAQWSAIAPVVLLTKEFGLHSVTKQQIESVIHLWRVIAHCLGVEDRYNCCLDSYEETYYMCKIILERDYQPALTYYIPDTKKYGFNVSYALAESMTPFAPLLSMEGLFDYINKNFEIPVYVKVHDERGYKLLLFLLQTLLRYSFFQWMATFILKTLLWIQLYRIDTIEKNFKKQSDVNILDGMSECPFMKSQYAY